MRITVNAHQLTPAQFDWLLKNVRQDYAIRPDDIRMCVTFEVGLSGNSGAFMHRELPVGEFVAIVEKLKRITQTAEAALTPDA